MTKYILDSSAAIALLRKEDGYEKISQLFNLENQILMSSINLFEVYYDALRNKTEEDARKTFSKILSWPIRIIFEVSFPHIEAAGYYKKAYRISVADALALGLAKIHHAALITSDHHEFDIIEKDNSAVFYWFR